MVGVRPLLGGLPRLDPVPGTVALVAVMIGTVTFDGLSQGQLWKDLAVQLNDGFEALGFGLETTPKLVATVGLAIGVAIAGGFYALGIEGRTLGRRRLRLRAPAAGVRAQPGADRDGLRRRPLPDVPALRGAVDLLPRLRSVAGGTCSGTATSAIDYGLLSQNAAWYLQVGFVVLGHVAALVLAHDRALALYGDPKLAVRSQYWMLAIMVGFTSLALWLLAQAAREATRRAGAAGAGGLRGSGGSGDEANSSGTSIVDPDGQAPLVNSLEVEPGSGALLVTTNRGFFRVAPGGEPEPIRGTASARGRSAPVGGFLEILPTGPEQLLGSGHPDVRGALPEYLGLLRSEDGGKTWVVAVAARRGRPAPDGREHDRLYAFDAARSARC